MDLELAAIIAHDTRDQAVHDARTDLHRLQQQAIEAGRDESRRLIKVSHINRDTGQASYRPAGRLLRDWYLHCYTNNLRHRLGSPAITIDAQQIEDTTALLRRLAPNQPPLAALRAVAMLRNIADADAAHATVSITTSLHAIAASRAIAHAPDMRFDADPIRIHVTRHWYLHSYLDHVHTATRTRQPHTYSDSVERQVAFTLTTRVVHPLFNDAATTLTTRTERNLAHEHAAADPDGAEDPQLVINEVSPEEAARLMFNHLDQLRSSVARRTEDPSTSTSPLQGSTEPMTASRSMGRVLPPRTA